MEIIKIDAELSEIPSTGVRYFGYAKFDDGVNKYKEWTPIHQWGSLPWFVSQDEVIECLKYIQNERTVIQVIILQAELPIKKLVLNK